MEQEKVFSVDSLLGSIIEKIMENEKKEAFLQYIGEIMERCAYLCRKGNEIRALNEIKFMISTLKKQLDV